MTIEELDLSVRSYNCLKRAMIPFNDNNKFVGLGFVHKGEIDM